jgi:hypothetical protein
MSSTGFTSDYIRHTYKVKSELKDYIFTTLSLRGQSKPIVRHSKN